MNRRFLVRTSDLRLLVAITGMGVWALSPTCLAQAPGAAASAPVDDLTAAYNEGLNAFQAGDYPKSIAAFTSIISNAGEGAQLETIYYSLGAAHFNAEHYPEAIAALKTYLEKYPKAASRLEALDSIGQAAMRVQNYPEAIAAFKQLENDPARQEDALLGEATAQKATGQLDAAITTLKTLLANGIRNSSTAGGAMMLAGLYAEKGDAENAVKLLDTLKEQTQLLDNVVKLNVQAVELGDRFLEKNMPSEALACYRLVQSRDEVIKLQKAKISSWRKQVEDNLVAVRADPSKAGQLIPRTAALRKNIGDSEKQLSDFEKLPDFQPGLWLRLARSFSDSGQKWEAVTVYDELLRKYSDIPEREAALYGLLVASAEAQRAPKVIRKLGDQYLKTFPAGPNVAVVIYLMGASALQADDPEQAVQLFGRALDTSTAGTYREEMRFLLGNARFSQNDFAGAFKDYEIYLTDFPSGDHVEEVDFRLALASLFAGDYESAKKQFDHYLEKFPQGQFRADVRYRLLVCEYAAGKYDDVISGAQTWDKEFAPDVLLGEVLALQADAYAAKEKPEEALALYIRAYKAATTEEVVNYSLFEAQKILQKNDDWDRMVAMLDEFAREHPDSPSSVTAIYWIGRAKTRDGKVDEAKQYVAGAIRRYIDDRSREAIEQLINQIVLLSVRKTPKGDPSADPGAELAKLLGMSEAKTPLAKARILYAQAELARMKKQPEEESKELQAIADQFPPKALSAAILARVGDFLVAKGQYDQAEKYFSTLMDSFPKSDFAEYAYNGLGQVAYGRGKYEQALKFFADAIDKGAASATLKEVTLGQAKTLLALGKLEEAQKTFQEVASVREWRGDATAFSMYSMGEIEQKKGRLPEAVALYKRVFISYRKFLPWVARSYLRSAECLEKMGKLKEAADTYREMLGNESLAAYPEYKQARERLDRIGNG